MAKVKAPFFGLGASGQLGGALVYFTWKGLDVVREYVIPANPQTTAQTTQRGYFAGGVTKWHIGGGEPLTAADKAAWGRYAGVLGPMSGFNAFVRAWVNERVAGGTPGHIFDFIAATQTAANFQITFSEGLAGLGDATLYTGLTRTFFDRSFTVAEAAGDYDSVAQLDGLYNVGDRVYCYATIGAAGADLTRSGLFAFTLTA